MTNTNLQHYSGESGLSYLSQMLVIIFMMFVSAATGYAACVAFIRGLAGKSRDNVGNFFADLIRITTRILLPFSIVGGLLLVWQGVPQNFEGNVVVKTLEGTFQTIAMGPIAALEIIKHLGTNGGGFLGANSATPLDAAAGGLRHHLRQDGGRQPQGAFAEYGSRPRTAGSPGRLHCKDLRPRGPQRFCRHGNSFPDWIEFVLLV